MEGFNKMKTSGYFDIKIIFLCFLIFISGCSGLIGEIKGKQRIETTIKKEEGFKPREEIPVEQVKKDKDVSKDEKLPTEQIKTQKIEQTPSKQVQVSQVRVIPQPKIEQKRGPGVVFNFDNADLYEVIRVMAEIMKINYIIDPRVKGVVNIHTSGHIPSEDVYPIFQSILKLNGATAIKRENFYEIIPLPEAKKRFISPLAPEEKDKLIPEERYIIQIIPLKYISVSEVSKLVKPFLSDGADIVEHPPHNILILADVATNVKKALEIINLFDIDIFTDLRVRIYPVFNADVTEIAKEMERIFSSFEVSTKSARGVGITFTPITRINSLLVVSSIPNIFEKVEGWLKELDKTPPEETKLGVFVYYVQNVKAKDLADVLKEVFIGKVKEKKEIPKAPEPTPRGVKPAPQPTPAKKEEEGVLPEGEITISVDETTNSLIIKAYERDYRRMLETIKKLDIYPKQVVIEVLLAEITLDENTQFGVEFMRLLDTASRGRYAQEFTLGTTPPTTIPGFGIRYSIVEAAGRFSSAIKAAADEGRLKVISSPHILASNNKEAKIQIGSSQPVLTSTYTTTATATTNVVEGTIEYKDIGIILSVTPRISDGGLVTLEIYIEDSSVDTTALGNLPAVPVFGKRTAKTILSIMEGQTIVIGGLIKDSKNVVKTGVPVLSRIPILGALFGTQQYTVNKTELIILMTPHIITSTQQSEEVTREFREKVEGIKKELERRR